VTVNVLTLLTINFQWYAIFNSYYSHCVPGSSALSFGNSVCRLQEGRPIFCRFYYAFASFRGKNTVYELFIVFFLLLHQ